MPQTPLIPRDGGWDWVPGVDSFGDPDDTPWLPSPASLVEWLRSNTCLDKAFGYRPGDRDQAHDHGHTACLMLRQAAQYIEDNEATQVRMCATLDEIEARIADRVEPCGCPSRIQRVTQMRRGCTVHDSDW